MFDIVVANGLAVLPTGAEPADIGVVSGKIAAIGTPGSLGAIGAGRTIDAAGQIVIPGGIDPHVHCRWPIVVPGTTQHQMTEGPARVSEAALHGGTTTIIDFALVGDGAMSSRQSNAGNGSGAATAIATMPFTRWFRASCRMN